jgi:hypothetical protein
MQLYLDNTAIDSGRISILIQASRIIQWFSVAIATLLVLTMFALIVMARSVPHSTPQTDFDFTHTNYINETSAGFQPAADQIRLD